MASDEWVLLEDFKASLANGGGAGSRTAAELDDLRLKYHLDTAHGEVGGALSRFTLDGAVIADPEGGSLLRGIVVDLAAYGATLEWNGSQPLEERDPVNLRYLSALRRLERIVAGKLTTPGVSANDPGTVTGEPAVYGGVDVNLAGEWAQEHPSTWHGMRTDW